MGKERIRIIDTPEGERIEVTPDTLCNRCLFSGSIIQPVCKRCFSGYCWKQYMKDPYVYGIRRYVIPERLFWLKGYWNIGGRN